MDLFNELFSQDLVPHGYCLNWRPAILWLHVASDAGIVLAYYAIPAALFYFVRRRKDVPFSWVFYLFSAFILACGTSHAVEIWTIWSPAYGIEGVVKAFTAVISLTTAALLLPLAPKALALRSPRELENVNAALQREIEEHIATEQELRLARAELEDRVLARTDELRRANESLECEVAERKRGEAQRREMDKRLRESQRLESLGLLAGGVAHDFNNLLTVILAQSTLAQQSDDAGPQARASIASAIDAATSAASLSGQMLAYAGRGAMRRESVDISQSVETLAPLIHAALPRNAIVHYHLHQDLPGAMVDVSQFRQILMNLVLNAAEALNGERGAVVVKTAETKLAEEEPASFEHSFLEADTLPCVVLEVSDRSSGIHPDDQQKIFDPYFSTKFAGRGLGLGVVLGIVRSHSGAVRLRSTPGEGSTFRILLPAADGPVLSVAAPAKQASSPVGSGETVLVVDDESGIRAVATAILQRSGFRVLTAESGEAALDVLRTSGPEVGTVVLDVTMPIMSGFETLKKIRDLGHGTPVILSSGFNESRFEIELSESGLSSFLRKPYLPRDLIDAVAAALKERSGAASG